MKRSALFCTVVLLVLSIVSASFAAGRLSVEQENFYTLEYYGYYQTSQVFAKVRNVGNKEISINNLLLELFDENGDPISSTEYGTIYCGTLQPDEYTYICIADMEELSEVSGVPDDYMLTVTGKSTITERNIRLQAEGDYVENEESGYWTYDYMYVYLTNNTEQDLFDITVVAVLLDAGENILYLDSHSLGDNVAIPAGGKLTVRIAVDSDFADYMEKNNLEPASLDIIAYSTVSASD